MKTHRRKIGWSFVSISSLVHKKQEIVETCPTHRLSPSRARVMTLAYKITASHITHRTIRPRDTDILAAFRMTPQPGVPPEECAAAVAALSLRPVHGQRYGLTSSPTWTDIAVRLLRHRACPWSRQRVHCLRCLSTRPVRRGFCHEPTNVS